jgi:hypothetical protein
MVKGQFKQARESVSDREEEGFSAMDTSPDEVTHTPNVRERKRKRKEEEDDEISECCLSLLWNFSLAWQTRVLFH